MTWLSSKYELRLCETSNFVTGLRTVFNIYTYIYIYIYSLDLELYAGGFTQELHVGSSRARIKTDIFHTCMYFIMKSVPIMELGKRCGTIKQFACTVVYLSINRSFLRVGIFCSNFLHAMHTVSS